MDYNWQIGKSLSKRMRYMLKHELMCDVTLLLGPDKSPIRAHKYMLASSSPVFYSMFEGPIAEKGDVWIPDIEPDTFKLLLETTDMDYNWQIGKSLSKRMRYMLKHELMCDVTLLLGPDKSPIRAHKYMLASSSPVFYSMFEGPIAEKGDVWIPDIEPDTFKLLLEYVYSGESKYIPSSMIHDVMYAADKYMLEGLKKECIIFLGLDLNSDISDDDDSISISDISDVADKDEGSGISVSDISSDFENNTDSSQSTEFVFQHLQTAVDFNIETVVNRCLRYICENGYECLKMEDFQTLSENFVTSILKSNLLQCKEEIIYEGMLDWATNQCRIKNQKCTDKNIRKVLGSLLYLIRYPLMKKNYFNTHVGSRSILTKAEIGQVRKFFTNKTLTRLFSASPRGSIQMFTCEVDENAIINWNDLEERLDLHVNCDVKLSGVYLFRPKFRWETGQYILTISCKPKKGSGLMTTTEGFLSFERDEKICYCKLSNVLDIGRDHECKIRLSLSRKGTSFLKGKNYKPEVSVGDVTVRFFKPKTNKVYQGQIAGIEISKI